MVDLLVDVWEHEGLYDWEIDCKRGETKKKKKDSVFHILSVFVCLRGFCK